ncbi:MAG: ABC transporter permease [Bifidobacteriaceae bacterium]|nr:ABC transporter permease [Bifidobacteriaceae bacterium]
MLDPELLELAPAAPRRSGVRRLVRQWTFMVPAAVIAVLLVVSLFPSVFAGIFGNGDPRVCDLYRSAGNPTAGHPFGFDTQGCDVYANVVYGARSSIVVGLTATAISVSIALILGVIAGFFGGGFDQVVSRLTDIFLGFPFILGAVVVLNSVGSRNALSVSVVLGIFGWPTMARLVRGSVRSVAGLDYVLAATTMGLSRLRIITRYVLPNAISPVLIFATISIGVVIVAESTLTYLGVGLAPPAISWGLQIAAGSRHFQTSPHMLLYPSIFLAITVLCVIVFGEGLRAAFDPRRHQ